MRASNSLSIAAVEQQLMRRGSRVGMVGRLTLEIAPPAVEPLVSAPPRRRRIMRRIAARIAALVFLLGAPVAAQPSIPQDVPPPPRPELPVSADPNSPIAYSTYGAVRMDTHPDAAYPGF